MEDKHFIKRAISMLNDSYEDDSIVYYLKEEGIAPDRIEPVIAIAKTEYLEQRHKSITKSNKRSFYIWSTLAGVTLILFMFVLPRFQFAVGHIFILSMLGSALCCLFSLLSFTYYKTWHEPFVQKIGRPKLQVPLLVLLWLPGVLLHFIFSGVFSATQDNMLKNTQVEVIGHVVGGSSLQVKRLVGGGGADISDITVEFETTEGQKLTVSKDVYASEFKNFYKGQEIHLIYSKANPQNIDLLADDSSIRKFKNTQERDLQATDLLQLISVSPQNMTSELNKISYGWVNTPGTNTWINEKRQCIITLNNGELHLIGNQEYNLSYAFYLERNGFTKTSKDDSDDLFSTGNKTFENDKYLFNVSAVVNQDGGHSVISVARK